jgi:hypothetical protein
MNYLSRGCLEKANFFLAFRSTRYFDRITKKGPRILFMSKKCFCGFLFILIFALHILPARAWDETGHKVTAYIAWQQMTPEVREKVFKILVAAPEDAQLSTFYLPYGSRSEEARKREFFMFAATWADVIKDKNFDTRYKKYNNSNWHYHDTLWTVKYGKVEYVNTLLGDGKLMEKLADFDKVIRGYASAADKAIAIAWLEHLIGDLHQPLHTTGHISGGPDDKGDQGGNRYSLGSKAGGRPLNLHSFWDSVIGQNMPNTADACDADYLDPIAQAITKAFPYSRLQSRLAAGKYDVWEKESVDISTTEVYKDVTPNEMPSDSYKRKALLIGEERLALAGYRMGDLFNDVFGTAPATVGPTTLDPAKPK